MCHKKKTIHGRIQLPKKADMHTHTHTHAFKLLHTGLSRWQALETVLLLVWRSLENYTYSTSSRTHTRDTSDLPKGTQITADCSEMEHSTLWTEERKRWQDTRHAAL